MGAAVSSGGWLHRRSTRTEPLELSRRDLRGRRLRRPPATLPHINAYTGHVASVAALHSERQRG
jgi:hypothetical protein